MNPSLPQTLQIAIFLLYFQTFFAVLDFISRAGQAQEARDIKGSGTANLVLLAIIALKVGGGYLLAQEKKIGYRLAIAAAFAPFAFNYWLSSSASGFSIIEHLCLGPLSDFNVLLWLVFQVALVALVLHPMSRDYQRIWFK